MHDGESLSLSASLKAPHTRHARPAMTRLKAPQADDYDCTRTKAGAGCWGRGDCIASDFPCVRVWCMHSRRWNPKNKSYSCCALAAATTIRCALCAPLCSRENNDIESEIWMDGRCDDDVCCFGTMRGCNALTGRSLANRDIPRYTQLMSNTLKRTDESQHVFAQTICTIYTWYRSDFAMHIEQSSSFAGAVKKTK